MVQTVRFSFLALLMFVLPPHARADPPPDLHALLTCDPSHGRFTLKTRESGYSFDGSTDQTADPDLTTVMPLAPGHRSICSLPEFKIEVAVENYRTGQERGECATWDKGDFAIMLKGKKLISIAAPQCSDNIRHDLDIQLKSNKRKKIPLWIVDCSYHSDYKTLFEEASNCKNIQPP